MNTVAQSPGNATAGNLPFNTPQSTSNNIAAAGAEFSVLISMLSSLMAGDVQVSPNAASQLTDMTGSAGDRNEDNATASGPTAYCSPISQTEQQLTEILSQNTQSAQERKGTEDQSKGSTSCAVAVLPFVIPSESFIATQGVPNQTAETQSQSAAIPLADFAELERKIAALIGTAQITAGGDAATEAQSTSVRQSINAQDVNAAETQSSSSIPRAKAVSADVLRLLSVAADGTQNTDLLKELDSLFEKSEGSATSSDLLQKLAIDSKVVASKPSDAAVLPIESSFVAGKLPTQPPSFLQDLNSAVASSTKASVQNSTSQIAGMPSISAHIGENNGNTTTTAITASASTTATGPANPVSQTPGRVEAAIPGQNPQSDSSQPNQDKKSSSGSEDALPNLVRQNATQTYATATDGGSVGTSFRQTLSAASGNSTASAMNPDPVQIAQSIVKEVNMMSEEGKTVVNVKLQPEDLGTVVLKVVSQDGKISAEFNVKTPDARTFVETAIPEMKQALQANGVSVTHFTVSLSAGDSNSRRPQYQPKKQQQRYFTDGSSEQIEGTRKFGYNTMELKV